MILSDLYCKTIAFTVMTIDSRGVRAKAGGTFNAIAIIQIRDYGALGSFSVLVHLGH